jgi:hypothetical protein
MTTLDAWVIMGRGRGRDACGAALVAAPLSSRAPPLSSRASPRRARLRSRKPWLGRQLDDESLRIDHGHPRRNAAAVPAVTADARYLSTEQV